LVSIAGAQSLKLLSINREQVKLNLKYFHHLPNFWNSVQNASMLDERKQFRAQRGVRYWRSSFGFV